MFVGHVQHGAAWAGPLWRQLHAKLGQRRHNMGNIAQCEASPMPRERGKYQWKCIFWRCRIRPVMSPMWSPCGAQFGPKLLGAKLRLVGPKPGQSWSQMGPSWVHVGALLAIVGPKVRPKLRTYGAQTWILTMLRPYAKDANYLNENHLFGGRSVLKMQPLLLKLYQLNSWFIRCIGSETKLPHVGFGVGGIIIIFHRIQWVPGVSKHFVSFHFPGPSATETSCLNEAVREFKWEQCQDQPTDGTWSEHLGFSRLSCAPWVKIRYVMYSFKVGWYASSCWRWWGFHLQHD